MICSPVRAVDQIYWPKRRTGTAMKAASVIVIPEGGAHDLMIVKLANGGFISSRDISKFAYLPGSYPWMDGTIKGLVKLGAISQQAADDHMAVCDKRTAERQAAYQADNFISLSESTGIPLSPAQQEYVDAHFKKGPVY